MFGYLIILFAFWFAVILTLVQQWMKSNKESSALIKYLDVSEEIDSIIRARLTRKTKQRLIRLLPKCRNADAQLSRDNPGQKIANLETRVHRFLNVLRDRAIV